jgi:hypothetical protein
MASVKAVKGKKAKVVGNAALSWRWQPLKDDC